jgi:hypothetical protein
VAKPVYGSDGAASWQAFRQGGGGEGVGGGYAEGKGSAAPKAPLKKADRLQFATWDDEVENERKVREDSGEARLGSGYQQFRLKRKKSEASAAGGADAGDSGGGGAQDGSVEENQPKRRPRRPLPADASDFVPASTFEGSKEGYAFTTRNGKTGYYWDEEERTDLGGDPASAGAAPRAKKKRKKVGHKSDADAVSITIVDTPDHPLQQLAAAIQRHHQHQMAGHAPPWAPSQPPPTPALPDGWEAAADPSSGNTYYYHRATGRRQWDAPSPSSPSLSAPPPAADSGAAGPAAVPDDSRPSQTLLLPAGWTAAKDPATGNDYFYHSETQETRWDRPVPPS